MKKPTLATAVKIVELLSFGLVKGVGSPEPGKMCVEAAVCFALGLPHGDNPPCVSGAVRSFKIALNDCAWSSNQARANGLRRLALAQLGSNEINDVIFVKELTLSVVRKIVPLALRAAAKINTSKKHRIKLEQRAVICEGVEDLCTASYASDAASYAARAAASAAASYAASYAASDASDASDAASYAARAAARAASAASYASYAASDAASDAALNTIAECGVEALILCKSLGCKWLELAA